MPLNPLLQAFLDQAAIFARPKMWDMPLSAVRQGFAGTMGMFSPRTVPSGPVENLTIPGPGGAIRARAYAPAAPSAQVLPALLYFHGGGFVAGDLDTHDGLCRLFAHEGGFRVIAIDYRLAPEHKWPAPLDDAQAALAWVFENAARLGVDPRRIAVGGDSAGGLITAALTQRARKQGGPAIACQLLLFASTEMTTDTPSMNKFAVGYFMEKQTIEWFFSQLLAEGTDRAAPDQSPLNAKDFAGLPPAYVMLGGYDPLHDEGQLYAQKLRAAGVTVEIADYAEMVHCFIYFQTLLPQARQAVSVAMKWARGVLAAA